jgi:Domain of unknown function (DUF4192)
MTTLTSPIDLLATVPFLIGYAPQNSLVIVGLKDDEMSLAMRVDYPEDIDPDQIDSLANHLVREASDGALLVAYLPENILDSESLLAPLREAIEMREIKVRECITVSGGKWRSSICKDPECCPPHGSDMPTLAETRVAAEQVAQGKPLPFPNLEQMLESIKSESNEEIKSFLKKIKNINYKADGVRVLQREGALAINDLAAEFAEKKMSGDNLLIALVLKRLSDLQVRDYAMGIVNEENMETMWSMWRYLMKMAPEGYIAPVATLFSAVNYERGDGSMASKALEIAFKDQPNYPLAKLLKRVYAAGWPPESFAKMRAELHPKVVATLFGGAE